MSMQALKDPQAPSCDPDADVCSGQEVNILVVDDLKEKLLVYETILSELGHNLMMAGSGEEALKLILKHEFAVVLLDVNMPGMDGFETAAMIRQRKKSAHTPIIFLTAFTDEVKINEGYANGAVDYLFTPVVPDILKAKVRVFIELFQMRQQAALQAEERARRLAAEEADRCKDEFLGMLAHELRNPLGPILNGVQLLERLAPKDRRLEQLCDLVDRQVTHMVRLVDDLLDSTRLAQGKILLRKEICDLTAIVQQTTDDYRSIFVESGLNLIIDVPKESLWVEGDPTRLAQAFGNLLHNAHKFSDRDGDVHVKLSRAEEGTIAISVKDTGIGIDSETLPYVFDVFRQAEQGLDRNRGGLGLGLTLVRGLINLHQGEVTAYSEGTGKGATFTIELPARKAMPATAPRKAHLVPKGRYRILLVEDNLDAAHSLHALLSHEGHEIRMAHSGPQALEAALDFKPAVILCDIGLPGMDGYQLIRALRRNRDSQIIRAIAMSGYGRAEDVRKAYEAGFDMHLTKPLNYESLRNALAGAAVNPEPEKACFG